MINIHKESLKSILLHENKVLEVKNKEKEQEIKLNELKIKYY